MTDRNQTCPKGRVSTHFGVQQKVLFKLRYNVWKKLPFSGHIANKSQTHTILQLSIEGLTANKMNVLHYLALHSEHSSFYYRRPTAVMHKVGTSKLLTSWIFLKHEAWSCHVCLRATKVYAFGPISTDIGY